jgi:A/G-specific adenine glycosylase
LSAVQEYFTNFNKTQFTTELIAWFLREQLDLPWRKTKNPYHIWISEIMHQQTPVYTVIPYYERFTKRFPTPNDLPAADQSEVLKHWEGLGYYSRVKNLQIVVQEVVEKYGGIVPDEKELFSQLKGVRPYTTGAVLSIAYGQAEPAVDGNVMRILSRVLGIYEDIAAPKTRKLFAAAVRQLINPAGITLNVIGIFEWGWYLTELTASFLIIGLIAGIITLGVHGDPSSFNQGLMEHGAMVCIPK